MLNTPLLTRLAKAEGRYSGQGTNHLDEKFKGDLLIAPDLDGVVIEIRFRATDSENSFHEERTFITEDLLQGGIGMWTISSNTPGMLALKLVGDSNDGSYATRVVFRMGEPDDMSRFRQEISLSIRLDGAIEYVYSWGVPHEKFGIKSKALLNLIV